MGRQRPLPAQLCVEPILVRNRTPGPRCTGVASTATIILALSSACVIPLSTVGSGLDAGADSVAPEGATGAEAGAPGSWSNVTANLAELPSQCGNMAYVSAKPDEDVLIAGIALAGLWGSNDGGSSWHAMGSGSDGGPALTNRTSLIVYDPQRAARYWESGLYNGGGVYVTNDDGTSYAQLGDVINSDVVSVDFTDPNRQTLVAGGHEQSQTLYRSTDGGQTWKSIGAGLPPQTNCTSPLVIDGQTYLVGCAGYGGGLSGIFRTTDGGATWKSATTFGGARAPLVASDHSIYWASPGGAGLARSTDQGQSWSNIVVPPYAVESLQPLELPDGRIATLGVVEGAQYVVLSADHGATWKVVSAALPYDDPSGLVYSSHRRAFYIWHFTCPGTGVVPVPADAIMSFAFDYSMS